MSLTWGGCHPREKDGTAKPARGAEGKDMTTVAERLHQRLGMSQIPPQYQQAIHHSCVDDPVSASATSTQPSNFRSPATPMATTTSLPRQLSMNPSYPRDSHSSTAHTVSDTIAAQLVRKRSAAHTLLARDPSAEPIEATARQEQRSRCSRIGDKQSPWARLVTWVASAPEPSGPTGDDYGAVLRDAPNRLGRLLDRATEERWKLRILSRTLREGMRAGPRKEELLILAFLVPPENTLLSGIILVTTESGAVDSLSLPQAVLALS